MEKNKNITFKVESEQEKELFFELKNFFKSYKRFWWLSVVSAVVLSVLSFVYFKVNYQPQYSSNVKFTITPLVSSDASSGASVYSFNYNSVLATQMASTFPHIINSNIMRDVIANDMNRDFYASISAVAVENTNIFEVTVHSYTAQDAYDVIWSIINNYPKVAEYIVGDTKMQVIEGSEPVLATEPFNKNAHVSKVVVLGVVGLLIGVIAAFIDMSARRVVVDKKDIENYFNGKCIGEIPAVDRKRSTSGIGMLRTGKFQSGFAESIKILKQRVRNRMDDRGVKIVGLTSTVANEGKTTVAYNLARALSNGDAKVLLVDMDLHGRDIQNILNRKKTVSNAGIVDVVLGKAQLGDVLNSVSDSFDVLFAGEESVKFRKERFAEVFKQLEQSYDYIVVDMPTVGIVSEAVSIADLCDEILYVIKANTVSPEKVYSSLTDIAFSDVNLMGFVLNETTASTQKRYYGAYARRYGYGYSYNYYRRYGRYNHYGNEASSTGEAQE